MKDICRRLSMQCSKYDVNVMTLLSQLLSTGDGVWQTSERMKANTHDGGLSYPGG